MGTGVRSKARAPGEGRREDFGSQDFQPGPGVQRFFDETRIMAAEAPALGPLGAGVQRDAGLVPLSAG